MGGLGRDLKQRGRERRPRPQDSAAIAKPARFRHISLMRAAEARPTRPFS